jgi:hypothetical protein
MSGKEILIFVGYYNKQKYENDVMSAATNFTKATTSPGSLILEFLKIESSK